MRYAYKTCDRREAYYTRAAPIIAVDPIHFYTRAERGRVLQFNLFPETRAREYERQEMLDAREPDLF